MQIVIDIDDNIYTRLFDNGGSSVTDMERICVAVRKGVIVLKEETEIVNVVLNRIRAEIGGLAAPNNVGVLRKVVRIIDKYKAKNEEWVSMSKARYKQGKQICSISEFDTCESDWYIDR